MTSPSERVTLTMVEVTAEVDKNQHKRRHAQIHWLIPYKTCCSVREACEMSFCAAVKGIVQPEMKTKTVSVAILTLTVLLDGFSILIRSIWRFESWFCVVLTLKPLFESLFRSCVWGWSLFQEYLNPFIMDCMKRLMHRDSRNFF